MDTYRLHVIYKPFVHSVIIRQGKIIKSSKQVKDFPFHIYNLHTSFQDFSKMLCIFIRMGV